MNFLAPFFLLASAAIALPILFHLIRRTTREKIPFSSLMFLSPSPPRVTRRSRLENLFLLLLRCLVFLLLALGFARPFLQKPMPADPAEATTHQRVILVDHSASMQRGGLWNQARDRVRDILRSADSDQIALLAFSRQVITLVDFEEWTATPPDERIPMALDRVRSSPPGWGDTDVAHALITALERLEELATDEVASRRDIVLITDLQSGSHLDAVQGMEWPAGIHLQLESLQPDLAGNAGFQALPDQPFQPGVAREDSLRIRIQNADDSDTEQFELAWKDVGGTEAPRKTLSVYTPAGQSRVINLTWPTNAGETASLALAGDPQPFDNVHHLVRTRDQTRHLLFLGQEQPEDPNALLFYLARAFPDIGGQRIEVVARNADTPFPPDQAKAARLLVVSGDPGAGGMERARQFLAQGKTVLHVLRSTNDAAALGALLGTTPSLTEAKLPNYAMLESLDFRHPLLSPFADPQFNDFTKIHFWKHRQLDTNGLDDVNIVATFDNGSPALLQIGGQVGDLFVLTAGWHPGDSQLALSSKFVPLLFSLMELSGSLSFRQSHYSTGSPVPAPASGRDASWTVKQPDGSEVTVNAGQPFTQTDAPGIYTILSDPPEYFAVNLNWQESRTSPLPEEMLERLGLPLERPEEEGSTMTAADKEHWHATELEKNQKLWQWLMMAGLVFLVFETWVAGRLSQSPAVES